MYSFLVGVVFADHPAAHGNAGLMNGVGIAGDERMPPGEIAALSEYAIGAGFRQPAERTDFFRG